MNDYENIEVVDFSIIPNGWKNFSFFDDMFLNMQGLNIGLTDQIISQYEYELLKEFFQTERTPTTSALVVSAFSQMWIFALYELLRLWRERKYQLEKWEKSGGLTQAIDNLKSTDDIDLNIAKTIRIRQIEEFRDNPDFRTQVLADWDDLEPLYRSVESFRMNLAKHVPAGKNNVIPRAPGYGRINIWCGAMDYEVYHKDDSFEFINRRDIADHLRYILSSRSASS